MLFSKITSFIIALTLSATQGAVASPLPKSDQGLVDTRQNNKPNRLSRSEIRRRDPILGCPGNEVPVFDPWDDVYVWRCEPLW